MSLMLSRGLGFVCAIGVAIAALAAVALLAGGAEAVSPIPTPPPTVHYTDVGVSVVKEEEITTQVGVMSNHVMTITVTNATYPADVHLTVLAVSKLGVCEATLVPIGTDSYLGFVTDEDNNSVLDTAYSELDIELSGMAFGETRVLQRSYTLVCDTATLPATPYEIQADVLPELPVQEANLGNAPTCPDPWCVPGVPGGPQTSSDNVHKNFPHVTITTVQPACAGSTPWPVPPGDGDCDGFTSSLETFVGTDPNSACGSNAWPVDLNNDSHINLTDVFIIIPHINTADNAPGSSLRFDLSGDGYINLTDAFDVIPILNQSCTQ